MSRHPVRDLAPATVPEVEPTGLKDMLAAMLGVRAEAASQSAGSQLIYVRTERFELTGPNAGVGRSVSYACEHHITVASPRRLPIGPRTIAAIAGAMALAGGAIGYGLYQTPPRRSQSVTILLNRPAAPATASAARSVPVTIGPAHAVPSAPSVAKGAAHSAPIDQERRATTQPADASAAINAAVVAAFATNEMQNWKSSENSGFVVVGPATLAAGTMCRDVAILTRSDGARDSTINSRRCQSHDGHMLPPEESPAIISSRDAAQPAADPH